LILKKKASDLGGLQTYLKLHSRLGYIIIIKEEKSITSPNDLAHNA
jgi:hypothetical protein